MSRECGTLIEKCHGGRPPVMGKAKGQTSRAAECATKRSDLDMMLEEEG